MDYYNKESPTEYLMHHGILGMKWGVRRFQNKDGTYTSAGKKRYEKASAERERLVREAESDRKSNEKEYEYYKKQYNTLKEEGAKGKTMRELYGDDVDDKDNFESPWGAKDAYEQYLEEFSMDVENYEQSVKAYTKYAEKLKNIDISDLSDKDVARKGKEALNEAWNEVMEEWRETHKDDY